MDSIRIMRGLKSELPISLDTGVPAFCTDTQELFIGMGAGQPLKQVTNPEAIGYLNKMQETSSILVGEVKNLQKSIDTVKNLVLEVSKDKWKLDSHTSLYEAEINYPTDNRILAYNAYDTAGEELFVSMDIKEKGRGILVSSTNEPTTLVLLLGDSGITEKTYLRKFINEGDWKDEKQDKVILIKHDLNTLNPLVKTFTPQGEYFASKYTVIDNNTVKLYNATKCKVNVDIFNPANKSLGTLDTFTTDNLREGLNNKYIVAKDKEYIKDTRDNISDMTGEVIEGRNYLEADNCLRGEVSELCIEGNTIQNLVTLDYKGVMGDGYFKINCDRKFAQVNVLKEHLMQEDTLYTYIVKVTKNTSTSGLCWNNSFSMEDRGGYIEPFKSKETGVKVFKANFNSKDPNKPESRFNWFECRELAGGEKVYKGEVEGYILVLEGDHTKDYKNYLPNMDIKSISSTGEDEGNVISLLTCGKNLLSAKPTLSSSKLIYESDSFLITEGKNNIGGGIYFNNLQVTPDTDYAFSITCQRLDPLTSQSNTIRVFMPDTQKYINVYLAQISNKLERIGASFHVPKDCKKISIWLGKSGEYEAVTRFRFDKDWQLEEGKHVTSYAPYVQPKRVDVVLPKPLIKIGEHTDYIKTINGKLYFIQYNEIDQFKGNNRSLSVIENKSSKDLVSFVLRYHDNELPANSATILVDKFPVIDTTKESDYQNLKHEGIFSYTDSSAKYVGAISKARIGKTSKDKFSDCYDALVAYFNSNPISIHTQLGAPRQILLEDMYPKLFRGYNKIEVLNKVAPSKIKAILPINPNIKLKSLEARIAKLEKATSTVALNTLDLKLKGDVH